MVQAWRSSASQFPTRTPRRRLVGDQFRHHCFTLNLVPYAGIAFLWFIGVIRDRLGDTEDRFIATVFLGSGLLFLALTFVGAALAGALLTSYADAGDALGSGVFTYGRAVMFQIINVYAIRMAGVFMLSLGTLWLLAPP